MALGHRQNHGVLHCAGVKLGRADQVADVFENRQIDVPGAQTFQPLPGHFGVKVAHTAGMQLDRLCPGPGDGAGIHIGVNVRFHHTDAQLIFEGCNGSAQRRGFAGPRCAHQVEQKHLLRFQISPQRGGLLVVGSKDALLHFQNFYVVHGMLLIQWYYLYFNIVYKNPQSTNPPKKKGRGG